MSIIKRQFAKIFKFEGRASRKEFIYFLIFRLAIYAITSIITLNLNIIKFDNAGSIVVLNAFIWYILLFFGLIIEITSFCLSIRRFHDTNKSGWYILVYLIPFVGFIIYFYHMFKKGDEWPNEYGEVVNI